MQLKWFQRFMELAVAGTNRADPHNPDLKLCSATLVQQSQTFNSQKLEEWFFVVFKDGCKNHKDQSSIWFSSNLLIFFIFFSMLEMNVCRTVRTCSSETDASVFFFFRSHSCANKVRERGWENGGLMYLIRGVALVIGGHATRGRVGKAGWDGRGTSMGDIHICKGTLLLRRQKQEKQSGEEPMLTCHWCGRDVALLYLRQCVRLIGAAAPRVWAEWNSVFCGEINICSTFSLDPSVLLCALTSLWASV